MHVSPRPGGQAAIRKIVLHLNVGPESTQGAQHLVDNVLSHEDGGYHEVVDNAAFVVAAGPGMLVWGAAGMNEAGYQICLIGTVQSAAQWADAYSTGELSVAAKRVAAACRAFGLPPVRLTDGQVADPNARGVCDHWSVNRAIQHGDHVDVGPNFPWDQFMALVGFFYSNGTPSIVTEGVDDMGMVVTMPGGTPTGRFKKYKLYPDQRAVLCSNGARLQGDTGPTPLGCWWHFKSTARPDGLDLARDGNGKPIGVVVTAEDDGTFEAFF